jgi:uncharacterized protein (TIGR02453 family)
MHKPVITKGVFNFLNLLEQNNNREWFTANKKVFKQEETQVKQFYAGLKEAMSAHDEIDKIKMFRIYRDIRFSQDKTPYKAHFAGSFARAGAGRRGGYYLQIKPGESFAATGFWDPNPNDLLRIRKELQVDAGRFRQVINANKFKSVWGELKGEEVKTAPKGFSKDDPNIDLIRKKRFIFVCPFTDAQVIDNDFLTEVNPCFRAVRPYFDLMSEILTTNLNGESLLD